MSLLTDLIAYWKLNEASGTRYDEHGGNDLLDFNSNVSSTTGKISDGASFPSSGSPNLRVTDNADLSTGDIDFTFAGWVKASSLPGSGSLKGIAAKATSAQEWAVYFDGTQNRIRFFVNKDSGFSQYVILSADSLGAPATDTWYFVVAWHDSVNNTVSIQVNNGTVDSTSYSGGCWDSTDPFTLGAYVGFSLHGVLDACAFWKRVLTSDERTELYNSGDGLDYDDFDGGSGDISGEANITEEADSVAAEGTVLVSGAGAITEGADTVTASSTVSITGTTSITEEADSVSSSGTVLASGLITLTEGADTVTSTGAVFIVGTVVIPEDSDTVSASGTITDPPPPSEELYPTLVLSIQNDIRTLHLEFDRLTLSPKFDRLDLYV